MNNIIQRLYSALLPLLDDIIITVILLCILAFVLFFGWRVNNIWHQSK
jgi:ABC-type multidrug transport system permease subunit